MGNISLLKFKLKLQEVEAFIYGPRNPKVVSKKEIHNSIPTSLEILILEPKESMLKV